MVLIFPVGVSAAYFQLLYSHRKKIMQDVETREKDEELMKLAFLFDPYKPEFWYFEVIKTGRRLLMTGVLSIIEPGTYTQLSWGMTLSIFFAVFLTALAPYNELRDNGIAVLSSALLILVFLMSSFKKYTLLNLDNAYDESGMDILLIISYSMVFVLFVWWALNQNDDMSVSTMALVKNTLSGKISFGSRASRNEDEEGATEKEVKPRLARAESFKKEFKAKGS